MDYRSLIREVPDFPSKGILFRDITPLLAEPKALAAVVDGLVERYQKSGIQKVVGIESRGFIFGAPLACRLDAGFVPARKLGKLPHSVIQESYDLEYGVNTLTMHTDAITAGERVLVIDDVIATGGTIAATCKLVERLGGRIVEVATIIELSFLNGREKLNGRPFYTVLSF